MGVGVDEARPGKAALQIYVFPGGVGLFPPADDADDLSVFHQQTLQIRLDGVFQTEVGVVKVFHIKSLGSLFKGNFCVNIF